MGFSDWLLRKSNVGSIARSVAKGWLAVLEKNPDFTSKEIAEIIISTRYALESKKELAKDAISGLSEKITPVDLAWALLCNENKSNQEAVLQNSTKWYQVMEDEIAKMGLDPLWKFQPKQQKS